jgi:hypothetical protein
MDNTNDDWLGSPEEIHEAENAMRAKLKLAEIYSTSNESVRLTADLVLGARKPLEVIRA